MVQRPATPRRQRVAVLGSVVALHALLLLLFLHQRQAVPPPPKPASIAMIAIAAERAPAAKPPPPVLPSKVAKTFKPIAELSIPDDAPSDAPVGGAESCSTMAAVLDALLQDPAAVAALRAAPPETRSISQAVMMWNEAWIPAAMDASTPLWTVRQNIEHSLTMVPDSCLDEPLIGPRLLPIPDAEAGSTTFVVFGSGNWTWRQMMTAPDTLATEAAVLAPQATSPTTPALTSPPR